jgi:rSAM/selenodomain-associated transferase 1
MKKQLIIFIKNPEKGKVKTRLAKSIGDEKALQVYHDLLDNCRVECLKVDAERYLYYSSFIDENDNWTSNSFHKKLQKGEGLGVRMSNAFEEAPSGKTIVIGSDCYELNASIIEEAFQALEKNQVVVGPANDGGYYLLGMNGFYPELFQNIDWSTERVFDQTKKKIKGLGLDCEILQELVDLDTLEDLEQSSYKFNN